jgi:DNA-binding NarL/FixJ family response regulator
MEVLRRVHEQEPALRVVVLSMYPAAQHAAQLRALGAAAYVSKNDPPEELIRAVRAVASGQRYERTPAAEAEALPRHRTLSAREHQVFTLVAQGQTVGEIAAELDLSSSTISNHLASIREKLGVRTVADIVRYAMEAGLIGPIVPH